MDALGTSICEFALRMTRARNAALVRWDTDRASGSVHSISGGDPRLAGLPLSEGSLVTKSRKQRKASSFNQDSMYQHNPLS